MAPQLSPVYATLPHLPDLSKLQSRPSPRYGLCIGLVHSSGQILSLHANRPGPLDSRSKHCSTIGRRRSCWPPLVVECKGWQMRLMRFKCFLNPSWKFIATFIQKEIQSYLISKYSFLIYQRSAPKCSRVYQTHQ
jgi:hypothetical protein